MERLQDSQRREARSGGVGNVTGEEDEGSDPDDEAERDQ
jgi:hypothetical protein